MRAFLFWPVSIISVLMLGITNLAPKLVAQHELNVQVTRSDQQILDMEAERQQLKKTLEIIHANPDFKHKLQLEYLGIEDLSEKIPQPIKTPVTKKKSKEKKTVKPANEKVDYKEDVVDLNSLMHKPVNSTQLPIPGEPWYFNFSEWLATPMVTRHVNLWGICLLGFSFALLHPGKIPSLWEIVAGIWQGLSERYGSKSR